MFDAARVVGDALREVYQRDAEYLKEHGHEFNGTFILGGQIKGEEPRLFHIYSAGNFIESSRRDAVLSDRRVEVRQAHHRPGDLAQLERLAQAAKCALVSMDSTIRSNLTVGRPWISPSSAATNFELATHISIDFDHRVLQDDPRRAGASRCKRCSASCRTRTGSAPRLVDIGRETVAGERLRPAHQEPLRVVDAQRAHGLQLGVRLYRLGHRLHAEITRHAHDGGDHGARDAIGGRRDDQRARSILK